MRIHKVIIKKEFSMKDNYVFIYKYDKESNMLTQIRYEKKYKDKNLELELEDFDITGKVIEMVYPHSDDFYLKIKDAQDLNLNDIPSNLNSVNSNILFSMTEKNNKCFYNRDIEAYNNKMSSDQLNVMNQHSVVFNVFKPFPNSEITDLVFHAQNDEDMIIDIDGVIDCGTVYPNLPKNNPLLTIVDNMAPDTICQGTVQLVNKNFEAVHVAGIEIYIKSNCGQLSHNKLVTDSNGEAKFKLNSSMLDVGEEIKVKVGFRYFTNIDNKVIKVVR